jgi:hypothetical protein
LKRIEESSAYWQLSVERYKFGVEREVLARADQRANEKRFEGPMERDVTGSGINKSRQRA